MSTGSKVAARVLEQVESVFGYPVADAGLRARLLASWESDVKDDSTFEEIFGFFAADAVAWRAEGHAGPPPEAAANAAAGDDDDDDDDLTPETPELVARHFCGLLPIQLVPVPRPARLWLADLNESVGQGGSAPIYVWFAGPFPEVAIFSSEDERQAVRKLVRELQRAADDEPAALGKLAAELRDKHPRAFALEHADLVKRNALPPALRKSPSDIALTDEAGTRLWGAYRAFLPAGRVLIERSEGQRRAQLTAAEAKALAAVAADGAWPPALLAALLGPALSGDAVGAKKTAQSVVKAKSGVPLTQRWARLIVDGEGPFAG